jgi:hypothetical protein
MPYFLLLGYTIQSHLDHPCTSYLASKPIDTNSRPKVALASFFNPFVTQGKGVVYLDKFDGICIKMYPVPEYMQ